MCSIAAVGGTNQHLKLFLSLDHGYSQGAAAQIASLVLASSLVGRLGMGWLADRIPKKYVMLLIYLLVAAAIPLLFLTRMQGAIYLFAVVFGIGLGGEYMVIPLMAAELFGVRVLGRAMGVVLTGDGVAEALAPVLVGRMHDVSGSYATGFLAVIGFAIAGASARHRARLDRSGCVPREPGGPGVLRCHVDESPRRQRAAGDRGREARVLREAASGHPRRSPRPGTSGRAAWREARRGAGQALPPGYPQVEASGRPRLLRPHPERARRVRVLGVRGGRPAGAAPVVELPQGGRRRDRSRHVRALALPARPYFRRGEGRAVHRHDAHPRARGRAGPALRGHGGRRRLRHICAGGARRRQRRTGSFLLGGGRVLRRLSAEPGRWARG